MHLPDAAYALLSLGLLVGHSSAMTKIKNCSGAPADGKHASSSASTSTTEPHGRATQGRPPSTAATQKSQRRLVSYFSAARISPGGLHTPRARRFSGLSGAHGAEPLDSPHLVPLCSRPTSTRTTPASNITAIEDAMRLTRAFWRAERIAEGARAGARDASQTHERAANVSAQRVAKVAVQVKRRRASASNAMKVIILAVSHWSPVTSLALYSKVIG